MKPKNVMLLGFVNRAVEYLDRHMDEEPDTRLAELKKIDLESLKAELSDNLDSSLGTMQSTMNTLLKAGNEAFDEFLEDNLGKTVVSQKIDRMFDIDFDSKENSKQNELAKLLSFYNLENDEDLISKQTIVGEETNPKDDAYLDQIRRNVTSDDSQVVDTTSQREYSDDKEIDSIFSEIVSNENDDNKLFTNKVNTLNEINNKQDDYNETKDSETVESALESNDRTYVSTLINDLREQFIADEKEKQEELDRNKEIYETISSKYPYLSNGFIKSVYDLKEKLNYDYNHNEKVIVLHRVAFDDVDNLRRFAEICLNHEYSANVDEEKMIVDVFREFINTEDRILSNIFEIANQGCLLNGRYEGYNVITNEEE